MGRTITAMFDGAVPRPDAPAGLIPNTRYVLTIERAGETTDERDAWHLLDDASGAIEGPEDWSSEHDHYLYGTPKRHASAE